jgi:hypothetical protein
MKLALLTGLAAAALFAGASGARAEIVYTNDPYFAADPHLPAPGYVTTAPGYVVTAPGYVYSAPAPLRAPGYVVTGPGYTVMAEPPAVVVAPPMGAPAAAPRVIPRNSGIVTTSYTSGPCFIDFRGIERCY